MKTAKELRELIARLSAEGQAIIAAQQRGETLSDDQQARLAALPGEIRQAKADLVAVEQRDADLDLITATNAEFNRRAPGANPAATQVGRDQPAQGQRNGHADARSDWAHPFFQTESFREFQRNNGRGATERFSVGSPFFDRRMRELREVVRHSADMSPEELRTIVSLAATSGIVQGTRLPGIYRQTGPRETRIRELFFNGRTDTGIISFVRETSRTNNAATYPETTSTGDTAKPESAVAFDIVTVTAKLVAHMIPVTRQMLDDIAAMEAWLDALLLEGLADVEDAQLLNGNGTGENILGLVNQTGVQNLDTTYFGTTEPMPVGSNELDRVRRAITKIRLVGRSRATAIVAHPADVEVWETMKDADGNYLLARGGPDGDGVPMVWRRPIFEHESVTQGQPIVGAFNDPNAAAVWDRMDAQVFMTDSHSNWFALNLIAMLAEERLALTVFRPKAFAVVTLRD